MGTALAIAQMVIGALPTLVSLFEEILGAAHPAVVAAAEAVTALKAAHATATAAVTSATHP